MKLHIVYLNSIWVNPRQTSKQGQEEGADGHGKQQNLSRVLKATCSLHMLIQVRGQWRTSTQVIWKPCLIRLLILWIWNLPLCISHRLPGDSRAAHLQLICWFLLQTSVWDWRGKLFWTCWLPDSYKALDSILPMEDLGRGHESRSLCKEQRPPLQTPCAQAGNKLHAVYSVTPGQGTVACLCDSTLALMLRCLFTPLFPNPIVSDNCMQLEVPKRWRVAVFPWTLYRPERAVSLREACFCGPPHTSLVPHLTVFIKSDTRNLLMVKFRVPVVQ